MLKSRQLGESSSCSRSFRHLGEQLLCWCSTLSCHKSLYQTTPPNKPETCHATSKTQNIQPPRFTRLCGESFLLSPVIQDFAIVNFNARLAAHPAVKEEHFAWLKRIMHESIQTAWEQQAANMGLSHQQRGRTYQTSKAIQET